MPITSSSQNVSNYASYGSGWVKMEANASGHLKVNVENDLSIDTTGLATDTLQTAGNASLSTLAGAVSGTEMQVDIVSSTGTLNVSDSTAQTSLASIDGKVVVCDTGAVVISSGSVTESNSAGILSDTNDIASNTLVIAGDTTSIDAKITACNTGAVVVSSSALPSGASTSALQTSGNASLSAIETSVAGTLRVDPIGTTAQPITASALPLPAGASTSALQTSGNSSLSAIEASHYADGDTIAAADTGVLIMGRNGTNTAKPIHITSNGDVEVEIADFVKGQAVMASSFPVVLASDQSIMSVKQADVVAKGSENNIENNASITAGSVSSLSADISDMKTANLLYEDTATSSFDYVDVEVSGDNGTNYHVVSQLYPNLNGAGTLRYAYLTIDIGGLTDMRIRNGSSTDTYTNVKCSVYGSP